MTREFPEIPRFRLPDRWGKEPPKAEKGAEAPADKKVKKLAPRVIIDLGKAINKKLEALGYKPLAHDERGYLPIPLSKEHALIPPAGEQAEYTELLELWGKYQHLVKELAKPGATRSYPIVRERVEAALGYLTDMATAFDRQVSSTLPESVQGVQADIIGKSWEVKEKVSQLREETLKSFEEQFSGKKRLSSGEIGTVTKMIKKAQSKSAKAMRDARVDIAAIIGTKGLSGEKKNRRMKQIKLFAKGKLLARVMQLFGIHKKAQRALSEAKEEMRKISHLKLWKPENELTGVEKQTLAAFGADQKKELARRAGVVGIRGIYRFQIETFSKGKIRKQQKVFEAVERGSIVREPIDVTIRNKGSAIQSTMTPLNQHFDTNVGVERIFEKTVGTGGVPSSNRFEPNIINAFATEVKNTQKEIAFEAIRHGILSDKYERNTDTRKDNSKKMAKELLKATLLKELARQGLKLEDLANQDPEKPLTINFNSMSLVTPDWPRAIGTHGANEKTMLRDQDYALQSFHNKEFFEIDGVKYPVKFNVMTFNYGVNAGATGRLAWAPGLKFGLDTQRKYNKLALERLGGSVDKFKILILEQMTGCDAYEYEKYEGAIEEVDRLWNDIEYLNRNKSAYLDGGNQYEVGAKIMLLMSLMDRTTPADRLGHATSLPSFRNAFNCMSGKDRTGIMGAVVRTFIILSERRGGKIPTHEELKHDKSLRLDFVKTFIQVAKEYGGLEITKDNGAIGYKVRKEAKLYQEAWKYLGEMFKDIQGLGKTTAA